jgi:hypothetical protein
MHIHYWHIFFILARIREEPGPTFMSPSSRSRWYRECQRTKRHRLVSNWRCLRGAGGPHSIQSGRSFPRTGSCVHIRRAPLREVLGLGRPVSADAESTAPPAALACPPAAPDTRPLAEGRPLSTSSMSPPPRLPAASNSPGTARAVSQSASRKQALSCVLRLEAWWHAMDPGFLNWRQILDFVLEHALLVIKQIV